MNIGSFIGRWTIQFASGVSGTLLQDGWILQIGLGTELGDSKPFLTPDYRVCVGFALIDPEDPESPIKISTEGYEGNQPAVLVLDGEQLRWNGFYEQRPSFIYISAAQTATPTGPSIHLYGSTTAGDPEQIAVWGGSGTPPPPPTPRKGGKGKDKGKGKSKGKGKGKQKG